MALPFDPLGGHLAQSPGVNTEIYFRKVRYGILNFRGTVVCPDCGREVRAFQMLVSSQGVQSS